MKTEYHKGVAIRVVKNVLMGPKPKAWVEGKWTLNKKNYMVKGDTKDYVITLAKKKIDMILGK